MNQTDSEYFRLLKLILEKGRVKHNRTGVDTIGVFGAQARFDVKYNAFPILTTKKIFFKGIVHELLWFIRGDTNIKYLVDNNVHIWDEWAFKRFLNTAPGSVVGGMGTHPTLVDFIQRIKDCPPYSSSLANWNEARFAIEWGELGEGTYGGMWRKFPYYDKDEIDPQVGYVDQLKKVIDKLKTNPDDRRMIVSAWHPYWVDHCALPPCHCLFHFNTEELTREERMDIWKKSNPPYNKQSGIGQFIDSEMEKDNIPKRRINLLLYQRSCDTFLGVPFNITSYSLLLALVAHCVNMVPGEFIHTYGDLHIYNNHLTQVKTQLERQPFMLPSLKLNPNKKNLFDFKYEDIELVNYTSHTPIKGEVAV